MKAKLVTPTSTAVGADVANSVKLAGPGAPVNVAFTVCRVEVPSESVVLATPLTSVVLGAGKMLSDFALLKRVKWENTLQY